MCGRYTLAVQLELVVDRFGCAATDLKHIPRYNIAPGQTVPVVIHDRERIIRPMRWGLVPYWAKEESIGQKLINARAETLSEKPSFRKSLESRRCIVPADGFYEWRQDDSGKGKTPMRIVLENQELFGFAGLWDRWKSPNGDDLLTYTIVTTEANAAMQRIHHRMPVILSREAEQLWLSPDLNGSDRLREVLRSSPDSVRAYEVSKAVNSPRLDAPECIAPVAQ
jgi:putative SOS response-associated peptidase YedK